MDQHKVVSLEDRIPKLKYQRKQKANRRLTLYLSFFFLLLVVITYFQSPLSDIRKVNVTGNHYVSKEEIVERAGLNKKTSFWGINKDGIKNELNSIVQIKQVNISRKFPNEVDITVEEFGRVAYLVKEGAYFPIIESGKVLDQLEGSKFPADAPLLVNWDAGHILEEMSAELSEVPESLKHRISEIHYTPVESDPLRITMYMNDGNIVSTTVRQFSHKVSSYASIIKEIDPDKKGIIHMKMNPYFEQFDNEEGLEIESEG